MPFSRIILFFFRSPNGKASQYIPTMYFNFIFKYRKVKSHTDPRLLCENFTFQKNQGRVGEYTLSESGKGILSGLGFNISGQLGENCFEDVLHSLIKWKKMAPAIVSRKHPTNMAKSHTLLPTQPCCESLPISHPWQLG